MNILITNIGRRGYLVDYFKEIPGFEGNVFTSDCDVTASGLYGKNDGHFILPKPVDDEKKYVTILIKTCIENNINVVLPVIDPEIYILAKYKKVFSENGITIIVSKRNVLDICFNKIKMNAFLHIIGVKYPKTYTSLSEFETAYQNSDITLPIVIKPILGSGSVDTYFVEDLNKIRVLFKPGMIIQEKLNGTEYGTDTFNSFNGIPLRCVIKKKISMRSGETDKSVSVHNEKIQETLIKIASRLRHIANLDCDVIESDNGIYVIDMNPRFGGGYPATHAIGVNLVKVLYDLLCDNNVKPEFGNYTDDILVMKTISVCTSFIHGL